MRCNFFYDVNILLAYCRYKVLLSLGVTVSITVGSIPDFCWFPECEELADSVPDELLRKLAGLAGAKGCLGLRALGSGFRVYSRVSSFGFRVSV